MKKTWFLQGILLLSFLSGCSSEVQSGLVKSASDFLTVASFNDLTVVSTSFKNVTGSSNPSGATASAQSSDASSEASSSHSAALYQNDNYVIANGTDNYIGLSGTYSGLTQYLLIDVTKKTGFVTSDGSLLDNARDLTKTLLQKDYGDLQTIYNGFKGYLGKSASDYENMTSLYLGYSYAGTTAGYTLRTSTQTTKEENVTVSSVTGEKTTVTTVNTSVFMTFDQYDGKWAFSNYSKRIETIIDETAFGKSNTVHRYAITEATVAVASAYPTLSVSLADYSVYLHDEGIKDVTLQDGIPLTGK